MEPYRKVLCSCSLVGVLLSLMMLLPGCVTRSQAKAQAEAAYLAGQRAAFRRMAAMQQSTSVFVFGPVAQPTVKWTKGLTLTQAIVEAKYTGTGNPSAILLTREGHTIRITPKQLLAGQNVPLEPGDSITIQH